MLQLYVDNDMWENCSKDYLFPLLDSFYKPNSELKKHYTITQNIVDCNFLVVPFPADMLRFKINKNRFEILKNLAKDYKKHILLFASGDAGLSIKNEYIVTIRLGGFESKFINTTFIMPPFIDDPYLILEKNNYLISKLDKPSIGFVGTANKNLDKLAKEYLLFLKNNFLRIIKKDLSDFQKFYPSSFYRCKYLLALQKNKSIDSNFIFRNKYRAGVKTDNDKLKTSLEFYNNIFENQYTFCLRGAGNFSVRFYETLAMGRIPILINTDCKLPLENQINWKNHCLIIDQKDISQLPSIVNNFHKSLSNENFIAMQKSNRLLWQDFLTKDNYFIKLHNELINI